VLLNPHISEHVKANQFDSMICGLHLSLKRKLKHMKRLLILVIIIPFLYCCNKQEKSNFQRENQDLLILSVLWYQKSGEMKALYYQGYNYAKMSLTEKLSRGRSTRSGAVVMDIDETLLDNSPVEAYQVINNMPFSDSLWKRWVKKCSAVPCPGALEFTKFADSLKVEVFYITNREMSEEYTPTLKNLRLLGFPFADSVHLVLKTDSSSKETRRKTIAEKYDILMLIGDNLADFNVIFEKRGNDFGLDAVKNNAKKFGIDYIILPNPMYGPWINAAVSGQDGVTMKEKILKSLKNF
jgi:5'-nucleotidase (lipoprotein e(P4) family)